LHANRVDQFVHWRSLALEQCALAIDVFGDGPNAGAIPLVGSARRRIDDLRAQLRRLGDRR